ncbi:MAG: DNA polymerase III subunit chi [Thiotrichales bacterium]|nr:DNA polymerase III subunit chi [Thiotrichales bacterium]
MTKTQTNTTSAQPEVVFYILNSSDLTSREQFMSKLLKKVVSEQRSADVVFETPTEAQRYDLSLWQYQPQSFIPHSLSRAEQAPIQLYAQTVSKPCFDILLNHQTQFPEVFSQYQRTIEILDQTPHLIEMGRARFKHYRQLGIEPQVHKIGFKTA